MKLRPRPKAAPKKKQRGLLLNPWRFVTGAEEEPDYDPYWFLVGSLLEFEGANGSTTITDTGPIPKAYTANSTAAISTAQSRYSTSSGYLPTGNSVRFEGPLCHDIFPDNANFTMEVDVRWVTVGAGYRAIVGNWWTMSALCWQLRSGNGTANSMEFVMSTNGTSITHTLVIPGPFSLNTWYRIKVCRKGRYVYGFVDNTLVATLDTTSTITLVSRTAFTSGGIRFATTGGATTGVNCYVDNFRWTRGVARAVATKPAETAVHKTTIGPSIRFVGRATAASESASYSVSLASLTGGIGGPILPGDVIVVVSAYGHTANSPPTVTGNVSGTYTSVVTAYVNSERDTNLRIAYAVQGETPDTSISIVRAAALYGASTTVGVFRGVDTTTPIDNSYALATAVNTARPTPANFTPSTPGALIITAAGGAQSYTGGSNWTFPDSSLYNSQQLGDGGNGRSSSGFTCNYWASGTHSRPQWLGATGNSGDSCAIATFALRPASPWPIP